MVITKNEEANIQDCLKSAQWTNELIVVDAESRDGRWRLPLPAGPRSCASLARLRSAEEFRDGEASSDWILILDADERVTEELRREITNLPQGMEFRRSCGLSDSQAELFLWGLGATRRSLSRLSGASVSARDGSYNDVAVHENLLVDGEIGTLAGHIDHFTERRIQDHFKKFGLYTTLAAQEKAKTVQTVRWTDLVFRPLVVWVKTYGLKQGCRDGVRGLIVCVFASMYTFVKYAKLWDATRRAASQPDRR